MTIKDVETESAKYPVISEAISHTWNRKNEKYSEEMKPYFQRRNDLTFKLGCLS